MQGYRLGDSWLTRVENSLAATRELLGQPYGRCELWGHCIIIIIIIKYICKALDRSATKAHVTVCDSPW